MISSWVELHQVENMSNSTQIELKMWATQLNLNSSSKCQLETQLDDQFKTHETVHLLIVSREAQCFATISEEEHAKRIH